MCISGNMNRQIIFVSIFSLLNTENIIFNIKYVLVQICISSNVYSFKFLINKIIIYKYNISINI